MSDKDDSGMNAEQTIFNEALNRPAGEQRSAFLQQACGGDLVLRDRVEQLLQAHEHAGSFLQSPPTSSIWVRDTSASTVEQPGTQIGCYKLLEQIGEGGMGIVFMAEQLHPVRRRVAMKIIKAGMDTRQVIARFEAERQALALMDHPNIAKVLDAGSTETGRPYVVMELVRGTPITEYCDQHRLNARERLELFISVCQAVQHAHQKGIIHRDLKPSNVLVSVADDGKPVPKVIDFGIAKAIGGQRLTDQTLFTEFRQLIGTPLYMSPEQAEMSALQDVDTRSDVYALGVLLYELLTGTTPFDKQRLAKAAYDEVRRIIREEEPPRPSTRLSTLAGERLTAISAQRQSDPRKLGQLVRGELDWIVMKALEKDRNRRYDSASSLGRDVQRYLSDEAVSACPPTAAYRTRKLLSRHKKEAAVAGAIAALLVLGIVGTSIGLIRANFALRRAQVAENLARDRKAAAEKALDDATKARDRAQHDAARADAVNKFMQGMLSAAQPGPYLRASDIRMVDVLESAAAMADEELTDQPEAEAQVRDTLGGTYQSLGMLHESEKQVREAYAAALKTDGEESKLAVSIATHWVFLLHEQKPAEAEALARKTYDIAKRRFGPDDPLTLGAAEVLALSMRNPEEATALYRELIGKLKKQDRIAEFSFVVQNNYAASLLRQGKADQAEKIQREVIKQLDNNPNVTVLNAARSRSLYTDILQEEGKTTEAKAYYEKALAFAQEKLGRSHPQSIETLGRYVDFLEETGDYREALTRLQELMEIWRKQDRQDDPSYLWCMTKTSLLLLRLGSLQDAVRTMNQVILRVQVVLGQVPTPWLEQWEQTLLAAGLGQEKEWKSPVWRANVWSALDAHLLENPGGAELPIDGVDWDKLRFRLEQWNPAESIHPASRPSLGRVTEGTMRELRSIIEPAPGVYHLSLDVPRLASNQLQHAESWLLFAPWEVDLYKPPTPESDPAAYQGLLSAPVTEHRVMRSLALPNDPEAKPGPDGTRQQYALSASTRIDIPAGRYRFSATSDDGVRVYVDGRPLINDWLGRSATRDNAVLDIAAGVHQFRVEYFQIGGGGQLWLQIAPTAEAPTAKLPVVSGDSLYGRSRSQFVVDLESRLTAEIKRRPHFAEPLVVRARFYAQTGKLSQAVEDYSHALRIDPSDYQVWCDSAIVALQAGDLAEYRRQCREMLTRFANSTDRTICERIVKECTSVPDAVPDLQLVMQLADRAVAPDDPDSPGMQQWRAMAKGMAEYRAGQFDDAASWLTRGSETGLPQGRVIARFFLAMAEFKCGRLIEAGASLRSGREILNSNAPDNDSLFGGDFGNWIIAFHAHREAAELLGHALPAPTTQMVEPLPPSAMQGLSEVDKDRLFRLASDIRRKPAEANPWAERAQFFGEHGRFELAVSDFQKAVANDVSRHWNWYVTAPILVRLGRLDEYRSWCGQMLRQFGASTDPATCERVVHVCTILPGTLLDMAPLSTLMDRALVPQTPEDTAARLWCELVKGMLEYRLGHFDEASHWLARPAETKNNAMRRSIAFCFLAMAEHQRGRLEQARAALQQGADIIDADGPRGDHWGYRFYDWIMAIEARRQAEELIGPVAATRPATVPN